MNPNAMPITELADSRFWGRRESTHSWIKWHRDHPKDVHPVHFPPEYVEP